MSSAFLRIHATTNQVFSKLGVQDKSYEELRSLLIEFGRRLDPTGAEFDRVVAGKPFRPKDKCADCEPKVETVYQECAECPACPECPALAQVNEEGAELGGEQGGDGEHECHCEDVCADLLGQQAIDEGVSSAGDEGSEAHAEDGEIDVVGDILADGDGHNKVGVDDDAPENSLEADFYGEGDDFYGGYGDEAHYHGEYGAYGEYGEYGDYDHDHYGDTYNDMHLDEGTLESCLHVCPHHHAVPGCLLVAAIDTARM